jgi:O-antigen ligase
MCLAAHGGGALNPAKTSPDHRFSVAWLLLVVFVFTIPWEKSVWIPAIGTIAHLAGLLAFGAGILAGIRRRQLRPPNAALLIAVLFVLWSGLTWFWSFDQAATRGRILTLAELLGMVWLIWDQCRGPARQLQLIGAYVCGSGFASCISLWRYFHHIQTYYLRYAAGGFDPNDFGLNLAIALPMTLYLALRGHGWIRWFWFASVPAILATILLTASRAGLLATCAALLFAVWTWRRGDWAYRIATVLFAAGLALSLRSGPAPQRQRLATIGHEISTGTLHDRTRIWKAGLRALRLRPIQGVGSGAYPKAVEPWLGKPTVKGFQYVAHNTFLSILVESGAVGFAICGVLMALLAFFVWSMAPPERALWTVVAAVWTVGVFTLTWEDHKPTWLIMALIMTQWARSAWAERKPL